VYRDTQFLTNDIEACKLNRRVELNAIVVQTGGWITDFEPKRFEIEYVVSAQIPEKVCKTRDRRLPRRLPFPSGPQIRRLFRLQQSCERNDPNAHLPHEARALQEVP
jgi:hypothetical protein